MKSEFMALSKDLVWVSNIILQSDPEGRRRIALAYREAQEPGRRHPEGQRRCPTAHRSLLRNV
ncbi:MAG: hypothetical protein CBARDCOR_3619 [uncultured Caballeronia sp.]|nr:MAG: hypothetical protein CBARDCOR_3619 [uncultured Caballeronia sp.]